MPDSDLIDFLHSDYKTNFPRLEDFSSWLSGTLKEMLREISIKPAVPIQTRIKTWESVKGKFERYKGFINQISKITDVYDLVGARIILTFEHDILKVCDALRQLPITYEQDKATTLSLDQFGYRSHHFVIKISDNWLSYPVRQEFTNLQCEIQVRTIAQHLWAEASHTLQYKSESSVPKPLRRSIHRVSALLELIDIEFSRTLENREQYKANLDRNIPKDEELNVDLLRKLLHDYLPINRYEYSSKTIDYLREQLVKCNINNARSLKELLDRTYDSVLKEENRLGNFFNQDQETYAGVDPYEVARFSKVDWVLYALKISNQAPDILI